MSIPPKLRSWIDEHGATAGAGAGLLIALVVALEPRRFTVRWAALAVILVVGGELARRRAPSFVAWIDRVQPKFRTRAARWLPSIGVALGTIWLLGPVAIGEMPASQDHASHYLATDILVRDLIGSGRLFGWTERLGAGYPFGDVYPTLSYLVTGFAHLVSFRLIPLDASYAIGICVVWLLVALSVARLAQRLGNGWTAAFAGLAAASDPGGDREGGWGYAMFHGVWTQQLGVGLWLFAVLALWRLTERADTRRLAVAGLLCGMTLLAHPLNAICLIVAGGLMVFLRLVAAREKPSRGALRLLPALAIGGVIGTGWLLRLFLYGGWIQSIPVYWAPLPEIIGNALTQGPFENQPAFISVFGLIGIAYALYARDLFARYVVLLGALLLTIGSMDLVLGLDLGLSGGTFRVLQYRRFAVPIKSLFLALSGVGFWVVCRGIVDVAKKTISNQPSRALRVLSGVALAPAAFALLYALPYLHEAPTGRPLTLRRAGELEHTRAIEDLLKREAQRLPPGALRRGVYMERPGHGGRYPTFAMVDAGYGLLPNLFLPAQNFARLARTDQREVMHRLGASVLITRWPLSDPLLEAVAEQGSHTVYRFVKPPPSPVEIDGGGRVEVLSWSDEEKVLRLSGVSPTTRLTLAMSPYPKWRARQADRPLSLYARMVGNVPLTAIQGLSDGELVLEYRELVREKIAGWLSLAALLLSCVGVLLRPRSLIAPSETVLRRLYLLLGGASFAACFAILLALFVRGRHAEYVEWLSGEPREADLGEILHLRSPDSITFQPELYCVTEYSRDPGWGCSETELRPLLSASPVRSDRVPSCLLVGVPPLGRTILSYELSGNPTVLKGRLGNAGRGGGVSGAMSFDNAWQPSALALDRGFRRPIPPGANAVTIMLENDSSMASSVCLEAALLEGPGSP